MLAAFFLRAGLFIGAGFALSHATAFGARRRIYRIAFEPGQLGREATAGLLALAFDAAAFATLFKLGAVEQATSDSLGRAVATFALMFVWIEVWFYVSHRAMHSRPLYWIHRQHHVAKVTNPLTSISFSIAERAVLVGGIAAFAALASRIMPFSVPGLVAVLATNDLMTVFVHANVEFVPRRVATSWLGRVFITPSFHAMHHARFRGNFGLYTRFLDRWFGTDFDDVDWVYGRAASGQGLTRFGEHRRN